MGKKYKITLLKDLPDIKAGAELLNITQEELDGTERYSSSHYFDNELCEIFNLRDNSEWTRVEEDTRCDCKTKSILYIRGGVIGYGRTFSVKLAFKEKEIYTWFSHRCDEGSAVVLPIKFCPLCGEPLESENKDGSKNI